MNRIVVLNSDEEYKSFYDKIIWAVCGRNRRRCNEYKGNTNFARPKSKTCYEFFAIRWVYI